MGRSFELLGDVLNRILYASQLAALLVVLLPVVFTVDGLASVAVALLFASLLAAVAVGLRRGSGSDEQGHLGTAEDITDDSFADPGQAARDRWETAVRRLPGRDDEQD